MKRSLNSGYQAWNEVVEDQGDNVVFKLTNHSVKEGGSFQSCWNKKKLLSKPAEKESISG